jgi:hypothetical protein
MRYQGGDGPCQGTAEEHPQFNLTMELLPEAEAARPARITLIEQVAAFVRPPPKKKGTSPPCKILTDRLEAIYGVGTTAVVQLDSSIFIEGSRKRRIAPPAHYVFVCTALWICTKQLIPWVFESS